MADNAPWLATARSLVGKVEDGPSILPLAQKIGEIFPDMAEYVKLVKPTTPWCGEFVAYCLAVHGIEPPFSISDDTHSFLWAHSWANDDWGVNVPTSEKRPGDIVVLDMGGSNHVTFFLADNGNGSWQCLGGNQSDQAKVSNYKSSSVISIRRPKGVTETLPAAPTIPSRFEKCIPVTLKWEGGNDDDPRDPGGRTSRGILQSEWDVWRKTHPGLPMDVWDAPQDQVLAIYREKYWDRMLCDQMPPGVDLTVFDFGVNSGRGVKVTQKTIGADPDGEVGPLTLAALSVKPSDKIINDICDARLSYLRGLGTWATFGRGWSNRVADVRATALSMVGQPTTQPEPTPMPTQQPAPSVEDKLDKLIALMDAQKQTPTFQALYKALVAWLPTLGVYGMIASVVLNAWGVLGSEPMAGADNATFVTGITGSLGAILSKLFAGDSTK